jgi:hypothetical protein
MFVLGGNVERCFAKGVAQGWIRAGPHQPTNDAGVAVARSEV